MRKGAAPLFLLCGGLSIWPAEGTTTAVLKNGPEGIVCLVTQPVTVTSLEKDPGWLNANVKGFLVRMPWSSIEATPGVFNLAVFQEAVALGAQYHKFVGLSVGAGANSPSWIYTEGAVQYPFLPPSGGPAMIMPEPWDPVFLGFWSALITALGQNFDGNASVAYIVMTGPGRDYETDFVTEPSDVASFELMDGPALWGQAAKQIAGLYAVSFPHTHLIYAMSPPTPDTTGATTISSTVTTLFTSYPYQFGVACASLAPTTTSTVPSVGFIKSESSQATVGFQMFSTAPVMAASEKKKGTTAVTVLSASLANASLFGAHYVEVYTTDCSTTTQQTNLQAADVSLVAISVASKSP